MEHKTAGDRMSGKVCVVTGADSGIGKATVLGIAGLGAWVVMVSRDLRFHKAQQRTQVVNYQPAYWRNQKTS